MWRWATKILVQIGRESLRKILDTGKLIHHIGDVRYFWKVEYVLGICAWLPASTLLCDTAKQKASKGDLQKDLIESGVAKPEAQLMADDTIYIGDYFSEAAARAGSSDGLGRRGFFGYKFGIRFRQCKDTNAVSEASAADVGAPREGAF